MTATAALVHAHPELAIFAAIVLGFAIGRFHFKGVGLGTVVGTLIAGLAIGILTKPEVPDLVKWAFFDLFLFAIGYGTGPQFFAGLKKEAIPQIYLALVVAFTGLAAALGVAWAFKFDAGFAAGVASGSLTQSAALGTALVTIADLPISAEARQTLSAHVPIADAVTYVMGDIGVILFLLAAAPMLLKANLREEAVKLEDSLARTAPTSAIRTALRRFSFRTYRVDAAALAGATVADLEASLRADRVYVERIRRDGRIIDNVRPDTLIAKDDVLAIGARQGAFVVANSVIGEEVNDEALLDFPVRKEALVVTSRRIAGHSIEELTQHYGRGLYIARIMRGQQELPVLPGTVIERGDVVRIVGSPANIERAIKTGGFVDPDPGRFALPFLAAGIAIGTVVGLAEVHIGNFPVGLGTSCAILVVGLVTGWARSRFPLFGGIPDDATRLLQDVGLTVFIAVVGLSAGPHAIAVLHDRGAAFFLTIAGAGLIVMLLPQLVGFWFGSRVLKMPLPILLGALAGAQTATPALNALKEAAGSNVFVLGYAIPYAINNVLLTLWGTVIVVVVNSWGR